MKLTTAEQNYILAIHRLSNGERVSTNQLAREIGIAAASVTDMVQKLAEKEFVRYEKYKGVSLLPTGLRVAKQLSGSVSLWREFLAEHLQLDAQEVETLLEQLQHVNSPRFSALFQAYLTNKEPVEIVGTAQNSTKEKAFPADLFSTTVEQPRVEVKREMPILNEEHRSPKELITTNAVGNSSRSYLSACEQGEMVYLVGLSPKFKKATDLFDFLSLPLGVRVEIKATHPFDGSVLVAYGEKEQLISRELAGIILVSR